MDEEYTKGIMKGLRLEKYCFECGALLEKRKFIRYTCFECKEVGLEVAEFKIDNKKCYRLDHNVCEHFSFNKNRFEEKEFETDGDCFSEVCQKIKRKITSKVPQMKELKKVCYQTRIDVERGGFSMDKIYAKLGEMDRIIFDRTRTIKELDDTDTNYSDIIRKLQLKKGDEIKVTLEKIEKKKQKRRRSKSFTW